MPLISDAALAMRLAMRDLRGRRRSLWLLVAGVFIGTAAVALVGTTSQSLIDGARRGALETVGGDLSLRLSHRPPSTAERAVIAREGEVGLTTELRTMVRTDGTGRGRDDSVLVELKGIDARYPLYGSATTRPGFDLSDGLGRVGGGGYGAVADPALFEALNLEPGDGIRIGERRYQLRGVLLQEPDRAFRAFTMGPRIIVSNASLAGSGLIDEGAEVYFYTRVKLPPGANGPRAAAAALARIDQAFPQSGWRMVNAHEGVPGVERSLSMAQVLLLFIGLGVMLIGGAGISAAVRAHVSEKMVIIAILKSVGATPRVVTLAMALEVMIAAGIGAILGIGLGAFGPAVLAAAMAEHLPFELESLPGIKPLLAAGLFGILVSALFAWWPLMGVRDMRAQVLLRERIIHPPGRQSRKRWLGAGCIASAIIGVIFWVSPMPMLTVAYLVGALILAGLYYLLGLGLQYGARLLSKGKRGHVRLALGNLYRQGAPTGPVIMALGLSLTLLVALDGIGAAASRHMHHVMPQSAPDLVAFSLKPDTAARLGAELKASGLAERQRIVPFLHARVQAINGVPVRKLDIPGSLQWVIRGDRGVSFAGEGLPDTGGGYSLDAGIANKLGLKKGDAITLNIGGHVREGPVTAFRHVDWTKLDLDFPIIAGAGVFDGIPHTFAASLKAAAGKDEDLERLIKDRFPGIPLIRVADVLSSLARAMEAMVSGLQSAALTCGLAALVVLAGSVLQGIRVRTEETILLKVLGARRRQLLGQLTMEFLVLGGLVSLVAVPLGLTIAAAVAGAAGLADPGVSWSGGLVLAATATVLTLTVGYFATYGAYTAIPARALRERRY